MVRPFAKLATWATPTHFSTTGRADRRWARFGYARVSTRDQNADHQIDALRAAGVPEENIVIEKISGKLSSRPKLNRMLDKLRAGDQVVVTRLKRIGRNHRHLLDLVAWFGERKVDFLVLEQGIDTSTLTGRLVFHFFAALAEYDREMINASALYLPRQELATSAHLPVPVEQRCSGGMRQEVPQIVQ